MTDPSPPSSTPLDPASSPYPLPRVTIRFCTQCKWMLRAAYFAQELLSTFSTGLGEVSLQPSTGGTFVVEIFFASAADPASTADATPSAPSVQQRVLWDRKVDGGFPETKELKRRVRDMIEPGRNLGHVDRDYSKKTKQPESQIQPQSSSAEGPDKVGEDSGTSKTDTSAREAPIQNTTTSVDDKQQSQQGECEDCK